MGKILQASFANVYKRMKSFGEQVLKEKIVLVAFDEMHTYIDSKKLLLERDCY